MGYANVTALSQMGQLHGAVMFNQVKGHCTAHCTRWLGCLFEAGHTDDYWNSLIENGATLARVTLKTGLKCTRVQVDAVNGDSLVGKHHKILMGGKEADADRSAESLASVIVPMLKACMNAKLQKSMSGCAEYQVTPHSGSPVTHMRNETHRLFTMNIMRRSAAGVVQASEGVFSMDLTRGTALVNHVVACASLAGAFRLFDPNWGEFTVNESNALSLVNAWWNDTARDKDYLSYNAVDIVASAAEAV